MEKLGAINHQMGLCSLAVGDANDRVGPRSPDQLTRPSIAGRVRHENLMGFQPTIDSSYIGSSCCFSFEIHCGQSCQYGRRSSCASNVSRFALSTALVSVHLRSEVFSS